MKGNPLLPQRRRGKNRNLLDKEREGWNTKLFKPFFLLFMVELGAESTRRMRSIDTALDNSQSRAQIA